MEASKKLCSYCRKPPLKDAAGNDIKMKVCSRCKSVCYHNIECQKKHWKEHKKACRYHNLSSSQTLASAPKNPVNSHKTKQKHRSMDPVHQRVTKRFKQLRSQGVSVQEAMKRAREEFQPSEKFDRDPATEGRLVYPFAIVCIIA